MTNDEDVWSAQGGNNEDFNDYPLAFINVQDDGTAQLNVDGDEIAAEKSSRTIQTEDGEETVEGFIFTGTYDGLNDISSEDNPKPSMNHLVDNDDQELTYAFGNVTALKNQFENVDEGAEVMVVFKGVVEPEDGLPWYNFSVYSR